MLKILNSQEAPQPKVIMKTTSYIMKNKEIMKQRTLYDKTWTEKGNITDIQKEKMIKVTDHDSHEKAAHDLLTPEANNVKKDVRNYKVYYHFCNRNYSLFLRTGFLQRSSNNKIVSWSQAP